MQGKLSTFKTGSQNDLILNYLQQGNTLTVETARKLRFGSNLRSRVSNIKDKGFNVISERIDTPTGFYARYFLYDVYLEKIQEHENCKSLKFNHLNDIMAHENIKEILEVKDFSLVEVYNKLLDGWEIYPF